MSLSLVYRATTRPLPLLPFHTPSTTRYAHRSAIHRGLIRSQRAGQRAEAPDPRRAEMDQLYKASRIGAVDADGNKLTYRQRHENRAALEAMRPQFKIRRGKKDITEYPDVARPKSRAARFMDPEDKFGKKSLVYKMKMGAGVTDALADQAFGTTGTRPDLDRRMLTTTRRQEKRGGGRRGRGRGGRDEGPLNVSDVVAELSRPMGAPRGSPAPSPRVQGQSREVVTPASVNRGSGGRGGFQGRDQGRDWSQTRRDTDDRGSVQRRDRPAPDRPSRGGFRDGFTRGRNEFTKGRDGFIGGNGFIRGSDGLFSQRDRVVNRSEGLPKARDREDLSSQDSAPNSPDAPLRATETPDSRQPHETPLEPAEPNAEASPAKTSAPPSTRFVKSGFHETVSIPYTTAASQFLYGRSVVEAALRASRRKLYRLYIYDGANRENTTTNTLLARLAKKRGVPVEFVKEGGLRLFDKLSQSRPHNGFILEASPLPRPPLTALGPIPPDYTTNPRIPLELGHQSAEDADINGNPTTLPAPPSPGHMPLVIVLDKVLDPGNLGAILRTVSFMGATAVGITRKHSASLTAVALKASAGAAESLALFSVNSLPDFITLSRANGWSVYAAVAGVTGSLPSGFSFDQDQDETSTSASTTTTETSTDTFTPTSPRPLPPMLKQRRQITPRDIEDADPLRHEPCVLIIGNEGDGLERLIVKKGDYELSIPNLAAPGSGVDSLNVNVAAALLCSAFLRGVNKELEEMGGAFLQKGVVGEGGGRKVAQALW